ncbi:MAG: hypothetical protein KC636_11795, partial [Myxococcales bacterium]|nr:hypothetical protein [Myxococcales bacterium]
RANIAGLAGDEQSVVLRTIYSKEWIHADMLWAYQVQRLADFQRRLEIPENRSRNPMFKIAEQAGELDKETGVKGLSLLGADLKEPAELVAVAGDAVD